MYKIVYLRRNISFFEPLSSPVYYFTESNPPFRRIFQKKEGVRKTLLETSVSPQTHLDRLSLIGTTPLDALEYEIADRGRQHGISSPVLKNPPCPVTDLFLSPQDSILFLCLLLCCDLQLVTNKNKSSYRSGIYFVLSRISAVFSGYHGSSAETALPVINFIIILAYLHRSA